MNSPLRLEHEFSCPYCGDIVYVVTVHFRPNSSGDYEWEGAHSRPLCPGWSGQGVVLKVTWPETSSHPSVTMHQDTPRARRHTDDVGYPEWPPLTLLN